MIKNLLTVLLTAAILIAPIAGVACGPGGVETVEAATATWLAQEKAVKLENPQGVSTKVQGLEIEEFEALSAIDEAEIEVVLEPRPGDIVVIRLTRKCGAEELIILNQYVELRNYVPDLNQTGKEVCEIIRGLLNILFGWAIPPLCGMLPSEGEVYGILKAEANKVETLPFVKSMGGCKFSMEALEIIEMPFSLAHKELAEEKEIMSVGEFEFQVFTLSEIHPNIQVQSVAEMPELVIWQGMTYQVQETEKEALVAGERQFVVRTTDNQLLKLYHVEEEEEWTLRELKVSPP